MILLINETYISSAWIVFRIVDRLSV